MCFPSEQRCIHRLKRRPYEYSIRNAIRILAESISQFKLVSSLLCLYSFRFPYRHIPPARRDIKARSYRHETFMTAQDPTANEQTKFLNSAMVLL